MILRLLNPQGIAGIAVSLTLALLLVIQKGEIRHWEKESGHFEQLYAREQAALSGTIANYRAAADAARAADRAAAERIETEQRIINERTSDEFNARLAAARSLAQRLRARAATAAADPRSRGSAPVPGFPAPAGRAAQGAGEDGLPDSDRQVATEQAIQLDELIKWVKAQAQVKPNDKGK